MGTSGVKTVLLFAAVMSAAGSCTVREDRTLCPCFLDLDYSQMLSEKLLSGESGSLDVTVLLPGRSCNSSFSIDVCPEKEEFQVDHGKAQVVAVLSSGRPAAFPEQGLLVTYAPGNEMDSVFVHSSSVDCNGEEALCVLRPLKQFSTVFFTDEDGGAQLRRYDAVIRGRICGFDASDLSPTDGEYRCTLRNCDEEGCMSVRVPRQKDSSLVLELYDKESRQRLFTVPVGTYLFESGYDPATTELTDYSIRISFGQLLAYLCIAGWEDEYIYKLFM